MPAPSRGPDGRFTRSGPPVRAYPRAQAALAALADGYRRTRTAGGALAAGAAAAGVAPAELLRRDGDPPVGNAADGP